MIGTQHRLTGTVRVALPPEAAFALFTPHGEERWVSGWRPRFPVPVDDDTAPGTVFETATHGETTVWVVADRDPGKRISYARVTPGSRAGTVTVHLDEDENGFSVVHVTYELTPLTADGRRVLDDFSSAYPDFLASWEAAIAALLSEPATEGAHE